jgi:hypothetical protein
MRPPDDRGLGPSPSPNCAPPEGRSGQRSDRARPAEPRLSVRALDLFQPRVRSDEVQRVLKDGHQSRKIGKFVTKGKMRGFPIFTLTLEERATCPRSCLQWATCFGNNMQAAERIVAGPELEAALWE